MGIGQQPMMQSLETKIEPSTNLIIKLGSNIIDLIFSDSTGNIVEYVQKEFKETPHYIEMEHDLETGYRMGVYICLGQPIHEVSYSNAIHFNNYKTFTNIHEELEKNDKIFIFLGEGTHKIKKKAEQIACEISIKLIDKYNN